MSDPQKERLRAIIEHGLSSVERERLAEQIEENPGLIYQMNKIIELKEEFINDAISYDKVLEEEEKFLEQLQLGGQPE